MRALIAFREQIRAHLAAQRGAYSDKGQAQIHQKNKMLKVNGVGDTDE